MDIAIVTGADHNYGPAICRQLVETGLRVYGLGRDFSSVSFRHPDFVPRVCDLLDPAEIETACREIQTAEQTIFALVNAGCYEPVNPLEAAPMEEIEHATRLGILAPLLVARYSLPSLVRLRGYLVNICPLPAEGGALAATVRGALAGMGKSLFAEVRDTGVKVSTVFLDPNAGGGDALARFREDPQSVIPHQRVAEAVAHILRFPEGSVPTEIILRPQATREDPVLPRTAPALKALKRPMQLPPPDKMPDLAESIPTPAPKRPDDAPTPEELEQWRQEAEEEERKFIEESADFLEEMGLKPGDDPESEESREKEKADKSRKRSRGKKGRSGEKKPKQQASEKQDKKEDKKEEPTAKPKKKAARKRAPRKKTTGKSTSTSKKKTSTSSSAEQPPKDKPEAPSSQQQKAPATPRRRRRKPSRTPPAGTSGGPDRE